MQLAGFSGSSTLAPRMAGVLGMCANTCRARQDRLTRKPVGLCVQHTFLPLANSSQASLPITHRNLLTTQDYMGMTSGAEERRDFSPGGTQRLQSQHDVFYCLLLTCHREVSAVPQESYPEFTPAHQALLSLLLLPTRFKTFPTVM